MYDEANRNINEYVHIENRNKITFKGISSVDSFDESIITATCSDGTYVTIEGNMLTVKDVDVENGTFEATGNINGLFYENAAVKKHGFFGRLMKKQ